MMMRVCLLSLVVAAAQGADFFEARCGACLAVADELSRATQSHDRQEFMDLELGGRIDTKGKRKAKIVEYAGSELRALEILEKTCKPMTNYGIVDQEGTAYYQKVKVDGPVTITGTVSIGSDQDKEDGRRLKTYCEALVEEHEETLTETLKTMAFPVGDYRPNLCVKTVKDCQAADVDTISKMLGPEPNLEDEEAQQKQQAKDDEKANEGGKKKSPPKKKKKKSAASSKKKKKTTAKKADL